MGFFSNLGWSLSQLVSPYVHQLVGPSMKKVFKKNCITKFFFWKILVHRSTATTAAISIGMKSN